MTSTPSSPRRTTPLSGSVSGSLLNLTTHTGYEPKYDVDNDTEITPIIHTNSDDRELDFSVNVISVDEQTSLAARKRQQQQQALFSIHHVSALTPALENRCREMEREREKKKQ